MSKEIDLGKVDGKFDNVYINIKDWNEIQKQRKALEIIKKKEVNVFDILATNCADYYNMCITQRISPKYCNSYFLTQEEFDLLKEVLL